MLIFFKFKNWRRVSFFRVQQDLYTSKDLVGQQPIIIIIIIII